MSNMRWMAFGCGLIALACGGADERPAKPVTTSEATVVKGKSADSRGESRQAELPAKVPGVEPIPIASFSQFVGFGRGDHRDEATRVLAWTAPGVGERKPLELSGSGGFRFQGHLEISWRADTERIDYISVRSREAIDYLESLGRTDAKLEALWGEPIGVVRTALGKPTLTADRPHAITYRYETAIAGGKVIVTIELGKLEQPPTCQAINVHWTYED